MVTSQENGSTAGATNLYYPVDQWFLGASYVGAGRVSIQQVVGYTPGGSPYRLRLSVTVAQVTIGSDLIYIRQKIEGNRIADFMWGSASAKPATVQVGVKTNLAGTYGIAIVNSGGTVSGGGTFTVSAGEVGLDLVKPVVIPGQTTGSWATDTGLGFDVIVYPPLRVRRTFCLPRATRLSCRCYLYKAPPRHRTVRLPSELRCIVVWQQIAGHQSRSY